MEIKKFFGLRNNVAPENMAVGELDVALDVDVDDAGAIRSREGLTRLGTTASHSMFARGDTCLLMQGSDLKRMAGDGSTTQLRRLSHAGPVAYAELDGTFYFTNGTDTGRVVRGESRNWGIRNPAGQPSAQVTIGYMPAGKYTYAVSFLRADGLESGTTTPGSIELTGTGGILLTGLPSSNDLDVIATNVYVSGPGGQELFFNQSVTMLSSTAVISNVRLGIAMDPDLIEPAPAGQLVEIHAGAAYVADGSVVWVSDQYSLERFRRRHRFLQFSGQVTLLGAVTGGLYAATDKGTWYLDGNDPSALNLREVLSYGATPGTMVKFDAPDLVGEGESSAQAQVGLMWVGAEGVIMGLSGGTVRVLADGDYSLPGGVRGAGILRSARGYASFVATIQGAGAPNAY